MSTPPTADKKKPDTAPEPKAKDKFLARLVEIFGAQKGVTIYQQYDVTEQELSDFIALAKKFDVNPRLLKQ